MAWLGLSNRQSKRLAALALCCVSSVWADEPWLARVQSVEPNRVTLAIENAAESGPHSAVVAVDPQSGPSGIAPGQLIQVWPGQPPGPDGIWNQARLVPFERGPGVTDRTGVRARIMFGAQRGFGGGRGGR
ncbi:hypothetical protein ThidrDRAFT_2397 [Thiorhodococcus drewsii AZ1]|uniref:Uncharacterized protein n=1 Tax=Thiorhodococcus drewsii AZ1 TaxID=765913 RepID=G2E284_9GAMM|nr:hypothetical protein [Thiorhodococcus drewsii]EGV31033.1 hypothetical protein ThidrDRAFT_2397 [Thiorhodococcus drewsii AZ1]